MEKGVQKELLVGVELGRKTVTDRTHEGWGSAIRAQSLQINEGQLNRARKYLFCSPRNQNPVHVNLQILDGNKSSRLLSNMASTILSLVDLRIGF